MHWLVSRKDIIAVRSCLHERRMLPLDERTAYIMRDEEGKTVVGAIYWNLGTITQDNPVFISIAILSCCLVIGLSLARAIITLA